MIGKKFDDVEAIKTIDEEAFWKKFFERLSGEESYTRQSVLAPKESTLKGIIFVLKIKNKFT